MQMSALVVLHLKQTNKLDLEKRSSAPVSVDRVCEGKVEPLFSDKRLENFFVVASGGDTSSLEARLILC